MLLQKYIVSNELLFQLHYFSIKNINHNFVQNVEKLLFPVSKCINLINNTEIFFSFKVCLFSDFTHMAY